MLDGRLTAAVVWALLGLFTFSFHFVSFIISLHALVSSSLCLCIPLRIRHRAKCTLDALSMGSMLLFRSLFREMVPAGVRATNKCRK